MNQVGSTSSVQWNFYLYDNDANVNPVFSWKLADSQGTIATGNWNYSGTGTFPNFNVSRAPVGTPTFTVNGYYNDPGCYEQLTGSGNLVHQ
jgi:hypothetical protein